MEKKIKEWIQTQGYPLEMKVANVFQRSGFPVIQSDYYKDIETGALREIDVVAYTHKKIENYLVRVEFVIECKTSQDKPYIMFTSNTRIAEPARVTQRAASTLGVRLLMGLAGRADVQRLFMFQVPARAGYGFTQAFGSGNDKAYEAAMSVSKATASAVINANEYEKSTRTKVCAIFLPIIVLSAKLVESYLGEDGNIKVEKMDDGVLLWRNQILGRPHTIITITTEESVAILAQRMYSSVSTFFAMLEKEGIHRTISRLTTGRS